MSRLKISAISYLNTAPLLWDFDRRPADSGFELSYTIPSGCAEALRQGAADIGIIPAAAYATIPDLFIIPGVAIAAQHQVRSILLISRQAAPSVSKEEWLRGVRTVALDTSSMTSVALTKILFAESMGGAREYKPMPPDLELMLSNCDAALIIGDPALQIDRSQYFTLDLAEEWVACTGKPAVFAFWAIRQQSLAGHDLAAIARAFKDSRDHGLAVENLETIAQKWAVSLGLPVEIIRAYLTQNIYYYLDDPCLQALQLFYRLGEKVGALPTAPVLRFI
jgi:chorismate dehydratase